MAHTARLLDHQARFVQAPYVFPETRFHFLIGGFACGKTSSLVYATMYAIKQLLGKKDAEGHNPKILIGSKNLTFLSKTFTNALEQNLKNTGSEYRFDRAKNIITVGNVELILVATEEPTAIYGYSCFEENTLITTSKGEVPIKDVKEGDYVLTTKGFKKVVKNINQGVKDCIKVTVDGTEIICTPDHKFIDCFDNEVEAKDLTKTTSLVKVDTKEWRKWSSMNGQIEQNQKLLISMVSDITDTLKVSLMEKGVITPAQMRTRRKVTQLCTEICGLLCMEQYQKVMTSTTKMETILTIQSKTLNVLKEVNTSKNIGSCSLKKENNKLLNQLRKLEKEILNFLKTLNTGKEDVNLLSSVQKEERLSVGVQSVEKSSQHIKQKLSTVVKNVKQKLTGFNARKVTGKTLREEPVLSARKSLKQTNTQLLKPAHLTAKTSNVVGQYTVYDLSVEDVHEYFANGVRVHNCVLGIIDELDELPTDIAMEAVRSINDRIRQQVDGFRTPFLCFATTSQGLKGMYQTIMHFKKSGMGYVLMRARTKDNTYLPADYVANMYSIYNEKEVKCLLEGEFISIDSGLVFPDYHPDVNKLETDLYEYVRDNNYDIYIGQDFNGFGNNAIAFAVVNGSIVAIKDYEFPDIRRAPEVFRYDFPRNRIVWIPDMTYKEHFGEFKKELRLFKITIAYRSCNPLVGDRNFACNKLFIAERLFICPMCKDTETTLLTWQKDPRTGLPSKGGKGAPDHKGDCMGYVVHYLLSWCRELKPLYQVTLERLYEARRARGAAAVELEVTTNLMSADKIKLSLKKATNDVSEE